MIRVLFRVGVVLALIGVGVYGARWMYVRHVPPGSGTPSQGEPEAFRQAAKHFAGSLLWSSTRTGDHEIHRLDLRNGDFRFERLTENPHVDTFPRFSPDGSKILFNRSRKPWVSFRDPKPWDVWIMDTDGRNERRVAEFGYHPSFTPDGNAVIFDRDGQVVRAGLDGSGEQVLFDARGQLGAGWVQEPDLRDGRLALTLRGGDIRAFGIVTLATGEFRSFPKPGCQITWWPGQDRLVWIRSHEGRGGNHVMSGPPDGQSMDVLMDLPRDHSHEYFPRLGPRGEWMVHGASAGGHEHDRADYEIFLWKVGQPWDQALRITHHSGNDQWPDVRPGR